LLTAISVSFASSLDSMSQNDPNIVVKATQSQPKPYHILGANSVELRSLGSSPETSVIGFQTLSPQRGIMKIECDENGLYFARGTQEGNQPFQESLNGFFDAVKSTIELSVTDKIRLFGFAPSYVGSVFARMTAGEGINISRSVVAGTQKITLSCGSFFEFGEPNIFASAGSVLLTFTNPESLLSGIALEWDPENSYVGTHPNSEYGDKLYLASIIGKASFLLEEKSKLEFIGFKTIKMVLNPRVLERLRREGRL